MFGISIKTKVTKPVLISLKVINLISKPFNSTSRVFLLQTYLLKHTNIPQNACERPLLSPSLKQRKNYELMKLSSDFNVPSYLHCVS